MEQLEALQFELESLLYTKNETELENFAASVKIDGDIAGKSKIAITKLIQKYIEEQISEEGEVPAKLEWFRKAIDSLKPKPQTNSESELALSELQKQIDELKERQQAELQSMMEKLSQAKIDAQETQVEGGETGSNSDNIVTVESSGAEKSPTNAHYLRREFKIAGQIGEPGQTDKLTFVSLTHQIDSGVKRKYSEHEIVDAVIQAISLHSSLRSYVETLHDVSLPKLRKILRVHYREKSASELYQQLATIFQQLKETDQQFLLRALDLRNKVGFASKESDCEVRYDESLIHKTFIKSFETGLRDDVLAASLRQILRSSTLTDEDLMRHVNELASDHAERQSKLSSERRFAKVNSCEVDPAEATTKKDIDANKQILAEIREIRSEVESLKRQQASQNSWNGKDDRRGSYTSRGPTTSSRHRGRGCEACKKRGLGDSCRHCFACGEHGHIASECEKNKPGTQGNERRLSRTGDRV